MNRRRHLLPIFRSVLVAAFCGCAALSGCAVSRAIPLVNLTDAGHQWVWPFFAQNQQPTVVAFWTTDEMECYRNVPALQALDAREGSVQLVSVVTGRDRLEIDRWIREKAIRYPVLLDLEEHLARALKVRHYPTFIYLDLEGKEVDRVEDIRLVRKWFDSPRWLERSGAR